ncbi:fe-s cluster biosynthesis protein ISA1 [Moesziomyces antarcticus T-34]|uniref:Iron-sulfur assembly protein 1 n=1 Tax=Pseudozyma antarctica (strain T-34) TaxID=1151754 RepID=M9MDX5_PSEA3|nr:fe-s cluster biosynthesis protein ISA1 [Moesziomyces antarcticus T-34]
MSIAPASTSLAAASRAARLSFLYPGASSCTVSTLSRTYTTRSRRRATAEHLRQPSSSRHVMPSTATAAAPRWLSTSAVPSTSTFSSRAHPAPTSSPSASSSRLAASRSFGSSSASSKPSSDPARASSSDTAAVDPACATLSPSSPAAPKSQKDPRAPTPSPATPAPAAADPAPTTNLTPSKAAELASDPSVAATMPQATAAATPPPKKASSDRGTKFRSRTAALKLTPTAVLRLRALMDSDSGPKMIRVGVRNKGCAGMSYHLEYIKPQEAGRFDERVKQDGVEVLIDSKALFSIIGSEMDWQEDRLSAKFVFNNPNVKEACGCGESFLT